MKRYSIFVLLACLGACQPKSDTKEEPAQQEQKQQPAPVDVKILITPGKSIGQLAVGANMDSVRQYLGKPYRTDGAMGSALFTWYNNNDTSSYQTRIFGSRNMGGADENILRTKNILVTSPEFATADSVHAGTDMEAIQKLYELKQKGQYKTHGHTVNIYADTPKGIAFEINTLNNMCVGIMVFKPGDQPSGYINMHE